MKDPDNHPSGVWNGVGQSTSLSLLERVKRGEPDGWRQLVSLYSPLVLARCRRAGLRESEAEEVAQEVFLTLLAKIGGFRKQPGPTFRAWLRAIARHKIGDQIRRSRGLACAVGGTDAQEALGQVPDDPTEVSLDEDEPSDRRLLYRRALMMVSSEFQPRSWRAVWLVVVEDRGVADVAAELGMTPNAVYIAKSRILGRLREVLADLGESEFEAGDRAELAGGIER